MTRNDGYASPGAVESAISAAARKASNTDPSLTIQERIRLEYFHRFLSRVFSEENDSNWMLKGGAGMLARVASARTTTDVDVFRRSASLDAALEDLRRLAAIDLSDFFRFDYVGHSTAVDGNQQTYAEGYRVSFDVYVGAKRKDRLSVDLVVNIITTDVVDIRLPANALDLPRLPSHPYRLYPVVDQVADKVCATLALYSGRPSSREKDLVDLVLLAVTQDVGAARLRRALEAEARARSLTLPTAFEIAAAWGARYAKLASRVAACSSHRSIGAAKELMRNFVDPVLDGSAANQSWDCSSLDWA